MFMRSKVRTWVALPARLLVCLYQLRLHVSSLSLSPCVCASLPCILGFRACFVAVWDLRDRCSFFLLWRIFCSFWRCSFFLLLRIFSSFAGEAERKGDKELEFLRFSISIRVMATSSLALHNVSCFSAEHVNAGTPRIQSSRRVLVCPHLATPPPPRRLFLCLCDTYVHIYFALSVLIVQVCVCVDRWIHEVLAFRICVEGILGFGEGSGGEI